MEISLLQLAPPTWTRTTLGEIVARGGGSIQTGPFGSQLHASDYVPEGVPSIMPVNIGENRLIRDGIACIRESDAQRLSRHIVRKGDIIYSRRGDVERRAIVRESEDGWFCGTGCLKVRLGHGVILPEFAAFYLGHPEVRSWIVRHAVGITMPNLNTSIMESVPFLLPPLNEQQAIAETLQSLDDKIEQNRRTGAKLEELARAVFKAWFVDFEPVKAKTAGATAFPGMPPETFATLPTRLVDSPLGPVPQGWEVGRFGDLIQIHDSRRIPLSKKQRDERRGTYRYYGAAGIVDFVDDFLFDGIYVLTGEDGTVSNEDGTPVTQYVWGKFWVNNHAHVLTAKPPFTNEYLLLLLQSLQVKPFVTGAVQPKLSQGNMKSIPVAMPPAPLAKTFGDIIGPLFSLVRCLANESGKLAALRDYLLPRLMSGRVTVSNNSPDFIE